MGKKCSSRLHQKLVLVLLLIVFPCLNLSAPLSGLVHQTGKTEHTNENSARRILDQSAKPASFKVKVRGIEDEEKSQQPEGRRLSIYFPNAGIRAGPSKSGQGGGRNPVAAP